MLTGSYLLRVSSSSRESSPTLLLLIRLLKPQVNSCYYQSYSYLSQASLKKSCFLYNNASSTTNSFLGQQAILKLQQDIIRDYYIYYSLKHYFCIKYSRLQQSNNTIKDLVLYSSKSHYCRQQIITKNSLLQTRQFTSLGVFFQEQQAIGYSAPSSLYCKRQPLIAYLNKSASTTIFLLESQYANRGALIRRSLSVLKASQHQSIQQKEASFFIKAIREVAILENFSINSQQ